MFDPGLNIGEVIDNRRLMDIFHCACEGGVRYSKKTGTVVLIVNNANPGLPNEQDGRVLRFAGRPFKEADVYAGANKRLKEFLDAGKPVFLFVADKPGRYAFRGPATYAGEPTVASSPEGVSYPVFHLLLPEA